MIEDKNRNENRNETREHGQDQNPVSGEQSLKERENRDLEDERKTKMEQSEKGSSGSGSENR